MYTPTAKLSIGWEGSFCPEKKGFMVWSFCHIDCKICILLRVLSWVWEWWYECERGDMSLRAMTPDWEWWCVLESDDMILRVVIPDWEWYQAEPTRVICWGSVNRVEWKPQSRHQVSFEIKRWPKSAGTEIFRHILILTFPSDEDEIFLDPSSVAIFFLAIPGPI